MDIYTVVVSVTILILIVTATDVLTNRLVSPKNKREVVVVCTFIFIAAVCEYIGEKTNGNGREFIALHRIAKLIEFCAAPCISIAAANAYGKLVYKKIAVSILAAHAIFEIVAMLFGLVFTIDSNSIYHREHLYWIYVATFVVSIICGYICIIRGNKQYQARLGITNIMILIFLSFGIGIQIVYRGIAVDFMCVAMGVFFLYHYRENIINQIDVTTRLLNRRCYERALENIKAPAYVIIFDINKFKTINDTYGHAEGDSCLRAVANEIFAVYSKFGLCYRIGGDEFCVIMRRGLDKINSLNIKLGDTAALLRPRYGDKFGVSIGYALYDGSKDIDGIIKKADEMMYENKRNNIA